MDKQYEDYLIREAFLVLAEEESFEQCPPPLEETSENMKFRAKINKLIVRKTTSFLGLDFREKWQQTLSKVAIIIFALLIVGFLSTNDISALRQSLVDFKKEEYGKGTAYKTTQKDSNFQVDNHYKLTYIPDNLTLNKYSYNIVFSDWEFIDDTGKFLAVTISSVNTTVAIDNENADKQFTVEIMGEQADVVLNDEYVIVIWFSNDVLYRVYGNVPENEIIKVAKNIIIVEEGVIG